MKSVKLVASICLVFAFGCSSGSTQPGDGTSGNGSASGNGISSGDNGGSGVGGSGNVAGSGSQSGTGTGSATGSSGGSGAGASGGSANSGSSSGSGSGSGTLPPSDAGTGVMVAPDGAITAPPDVAGCGSSKFYKTSDNLAVAGPWPVGVQTTQLMLSGVMANVEIWYPAKLGSDQGQTAATYDLRSWLPKGQAMLIPDSANKLATCNCYRGLPLDTSHGPYPGVIFIHGTGSFRIASLSTMTSWASRGFVVVAADHPGLFLTDFLASGNCQGGGTGTANASGTLNLADVDAEVTAMTGKTGGFAFLGSSLDMSRIGVGGHSQGASGAASASSRPGVPNVQVDMPLADLGGTIPTGSSLKSVLFMGGANDSVVSYSSDVSAYTGSTAAKKRVVGIAAGDHLDVTDLCYQTNSMGKTAIQVADQYNVCGTGAPSAALTLLNGLAKCGNVMPPIAGPEIVNYATTAALEETLHCVNRDAAFSALKSTYPQVSDFQHMP